MKVLITGANGQLGKEFSKYFFMGKIDYLSTNKSNFDITNLEQMREFLKSYKDITHIINCAAYTNVDEAENNWNKAYLINSKGVKNLVEISKEINSELIHFSTNYVFSGEKGNYSTKDNTNPINKYGESKALGEKELKENKKTFLIRTSWLFGQNGDNFVKKIIKLSKNSKTLKIVTDEKSSPTYTKDLVIATMNLLKTKKYGIYHITNTSCTRYEWAEYILKEVGWKGELIKAKQKDFDLKAKRPKSSVLDISKVERVTGTKMQSWQNATDRFLKEETF